MAEEIFKKEADALKRAHAALAETQGLDPKVEKSFRQLVKRYAKLLRQSGRMATMGDRIQNSLNILNRELASSESRYRGVFENVTEGIYRSSGDGRLVEINPSMASMFGQADCRAFLGKIKNIKELFCTLADYERYESLLISNGVHREEVQVRGPAEQTLWVEISASLILGEDGEIDTIVGVLSDVTERKRMLEDMCRLARTDSLTGLWNRGYFMELAARELARSLRSGGPMALLILDVDYFKAVNDTHGHDVGDHALTGIAAVLRSSVREVDIVARYGGEEFVVLLPDAPPAEAAVVADRIGSQLRANVLDCGSVQIRVTASIGLTSLQPDDNLDGLLKFADIALYAAKKKGRDRVEVYRRNPESCPARPESKEGLLPAGDRQ